MSSPRRCAWCKTELSPSCRRDTLFCGRKCRQSAFRLNQQTALLARTSKPGRFAYSDPPYPGTAWRYYKMPEVDHRAMIADLESRELMGYAISTSAEALRDVLPLCPAGARVCAWVKPHNPHPATNGLHNCWEPLIVVRGRQLPPGRRDWLRAHPARMGGTLPGRKPLAFCRWLFECLGMVPGDELDDLFPGTGIVTRSWAYLSSRPGGDVSLVNGADVSVEVLNDVSQEGPSDVSVEVLNDVSQEGPSDVSVEVLNDVSQSAGNDTSLIASVDG